MEKNNREHNNHYRINYAICVECKVRCFAGHDDDGQIYCACCGHSFLPKEVISMTEAEAREKNAKAKKIYERGGWIAYKD